MNFLEKLRNLPLNIRKIILWSVVGILSVSLLTWWIISIPKRVESFQKEQFLEEITPPSFQEKSKTSEESEKTSQEAESKSPSWKEIKESFKEVETELQKLENQKPEQ